MPDVPPAATSVAGAAAAALVLGPLVPWPDVFNATDPVARAEAAPAGKKAPYRIIVEDETGDPDSYRSVRLAHRDTVDYDPDNPNTFDRNTVMCLANCFIHRHDLTRHFQLVEVWNALHGEVFT